MKTSEKRYSNTTYMILCGLFAALTAICSFITIPLGFTPIPLNLGTLGMFLAGGILGKKYGTLSISVYVLMGATGVPVFAGFRAGLSVLAGPTGGYIAGYIAGAFIIGSILDAALRNDAGKNAATKKSRKLDSDGQNTDPNSALQADSAKQDDNPTDTPQPDSGSQNAKRMKRPWIYIIALSLGMAICYFLGTLWFMYSTKTGLYASLLACVVPFLAGDAVKIIVATLLIRKLRPLVR